MNAELVSVIIPVYYGEKYLLETLASVSSSNHPAVEVIIVNDGSADSTLAIALEFKARETRFKVEVVSQENQGESAAINAGLAVAKGAYVLVLSSDDLVHPDLFRDAVALLERNPEASLCYPDWEMIDHEGRPMGTVYGLDWDLKMLFFARYPK